MPIPLDVGDIDAPVELHVLCERCDVIRTWLQDNPLPIAYRTVEPNQFPHYKSFQQKTLMLEAAIFVRLSGPAFSVMDHYSSDLAYHAKTELKNETSARKRGLPSR